MLSVVSQRYPCPVKRDDGSPTGLELHKLISADTAIPVIFITDVDGQTAVSKCWKMPESRY